VLSFEPLYMERVWGGRRLAEQFGRTLPDGALIGESWEIVDRPEAQSVVEGGGPTLGELWRSERRAELFGRRARGERFPLLIKLLDCSDTLSVQVHPPAAVAAALGGEPKSEMWVVLEGGQLFAGLRAGVSRADFEAALGGGADVSPLLHRIDTTAGDVMFLPSGRVHAIGAGNMIAEIQQNSDTTYRVFDWGRPRELHVEQSLASIDFSDAEPALVVPDGDALVHSEAFEIDRFVVDGPRPAAPAGECAILAGLDGAITAGGETFAAGRFVIATAAENASVGPAADAPVTVLRAMLPA
jgi:mannose-6-phosphate isomerase